MTLNWSMTSGAGAYKVEIRNPDGKIIVTETVTEPRIQLEILPGKYEMRITALNRFMRESGSTAWMPFSVLRRKPPVVNSISPRVLLPGEGGTLVLHGAEFGDDTAAALGGQSPTPLRFELVSPNELRVKIPPIERRGAYDLILTNKPDLSVTVPGAFLVRYPDPVAEALKPSVLDFEEIDRQITIAGKAFYDGITAALVRENRRIALPLERISLAELRSSVPSGIEAGTWDLELANDSESLSVRSGALTVVFAVPVPVSIEPSFIDFDASNKSVVARGGSFYSTVSAALVSGRSRIELESSRVSASELRFSVPEDLAIGSWDLEIANNTAAKGDSRRRAHYRPHGAVSGAPLGNS